MVGTSGGELGIRGYIAALDANDGKQVWKTYTVPGPGEPGHDTWPGETWKTGGVSVWLTAHYDPQTNLSFWGTGNGAPWMGDMRPGDNLFATSVLALDVDTGKIRGYHQYHWNDSWDWDEVSTPLLIDFPKDGRTVKGLVHPGRNGYLWRLERTADKIKFVDAQPYVIQEVFTKIDPVTGRPSYNEERKPRSGATVTFCPGLWGGKDWTPAGYSPKTQYLYIPANENLCSTLAGLPKPEPYEPGKLYLGVDRPKSAMSWRQGANHIGELPRSRTGGPSSPPAAAWWSWAAPTIVTSGRSTPRPAPSCGRSRPTLGSLACRALSRSTACSTSPFSPAGASTLSGCRPGSTRSATPRPRCHRVAWSGCSLSGTERTSGPAKARGG
jgi:alcohol dehydrogenase (cytochrome c)